MIINQSSQSSFKNPQILSRDSEKINLLVSKVATFVVPHVPLGPEALSAALWALERPLIDMDPHVNA